MKVAIIGAGITGLYLAWKLAERGEDVTVFEKRGRIGKDVCSGLFSERILKFIPQSEKLIENQINFVLIHFPKKTIRIDFARKFFVMNHAELDRLAAGLAQTSGAKIILRSDPAKAGSDLADFVIGCDGAISDTRRSLGLKDPQFRLGMLRIAPEKNSSNRVEVWPVRGGFSWKIPRGLNTEYGMIIPQGIGRYDGYRISIIPQGFIIPKNDKITLCGDAAGLTKPWSGGGVVWGLTAADLLLRNFPNFVKYQQAAKKLFLPQIILSKMAMKIVYFLGFKFPWLLPGRIKIDGDFIIL